MSISEIWILRCPEVTKGYTLLHGYHTRSSKRFYVSQQFYSCVGKYLSTHCTCNVLNLKEAVRLRSLALSFVLVRNGSCKCLMKDFNDSNPWRQVFFFLRDSAPHGRDKWKRFLLVNRGITECCRSMFLENKCMFGKVVLFVCNYFCCLLVCLNWRKYF